VFGYLNLVLLVDINVLFFAGRQLERQAEPLLRLLHAVGTVDSALSVASLRAGTEFWARPVFDSSGGVRMTAIRHPLLPDAVPNSLAVDAERGVIVTGSNMSGKSTFLRTVGVTAIMAQSLNTCLATGYEASRLRVRSAIGRSDDLLAGKSYYLAEVESVLELVRAAATEQPHLLLFDELFRGTNAVERIAAGSAVLATLIGDANGRGPVPHIVLVATHDGELVELLAGSYAAVHFEEQVTAEGLSFDYRLRSGPARTRNAIALLELQGAPEGLVRLARERARLIEAERTRHG
jgi:DNA mismatch repair ATPase MutS